MCVFLFVELGGLLTFLLFSVKTFGHNLRGSEVVSEA